MHGRIVHPRGGARAPRAIDRLCALADMPKPRVAIADTDVPNAFATGRSPKAAVVCATTGLLRRLDEPRSRPCSPTSSPTSPTETSRS